MSFFDDLRSCSLDMFHSKTKTRRSVWNNCVFHCNVLRWLNKCKIFDSDIGNGINLCLEVRWIEMNNFLRHFRCFRCVYTKVEKYRKRLLGWFHRATPKPCGQFVRKNVRKKVQKNVWNSKCFSYENEALFSEFRTTYFRKHSGAIPHVFPNVQLNCQNVRNISMNDRKNVWNISECFQILHLNVRSVEKNASFS